MTKKKIYLLIFILFIGFGTYLVANTIELAKYKKTLAVGSELPNATFINLKQEHFSTNSISENRSVVLFFSIHCPHCQTELESLNANLEILNTIAFYLIGKESVEEIDKFTEQFPRLKSVTTLLSDRDDEFLKKFGSSVVPNAFVYEKRKLVQQYKGVFDHHRLKETSQP